MDLAKSERTTLRRRVTRKINELKDSVNNLDEAELTAHIDMLNDFQSELKVLDSKILLAVRSSQNADLDEIEKMEDDCYDYLMKIKYGISLIKVRLKSLHSQGATIGNGSGGSVEAPNRTRINLPKLELPEYCADEKQDKLTCSRFFDTFEHLVQPYHLNEVEKFNLLEQQCKGRAKAMIFSLSVVNQNYTQAKQILVKSFGDEMPQKFAFVKQLTELKLVHGKDDPYLYYSKFTTIVNSIKESNIDIDIILLYFIWNGLPCKFQDILVSITNKSQPDFTDVTTKFLEASSRYLAQIGGDPIKRKVEPSCLSFSSTHKLDCILCLGNNHRIANCTKYAEPTQKLDRLKELGLCFKCLKEGHYSQNCKFSTTGKCKKCLQYNHWSFLCTFKDKNKGDEQSSNPKDKSSKTSSTTQKKAQTVPKTNVGAASIEVHDEGAVTTSLSAVSSQLNITDSLLPLLTVQFERDSTVVVDTVLDNGSQNSFMVTELADRLDLEVLDSNVTVLVKGFNTYQRINTKLVKFPIIIGHIIYNLTCICVPVIKINFNTPGVNTLVNLIKSEGFLFAYNQFDGLSDVQKVCDIQLLIGAKDWGLVHSMKAGVVGPPDRLTAYYEAPHGLILVGSVQDWLENYKLLVLGDLEGNRKLKQTESLTSMTISTAKTKENFFNEIKTVSNVVLVEHDYDLILDNVPLESEANVAELGSEVGGDDLLELASYGELDKTCKWLLNIEGFSGEEELLDMEKEVTDFIFDNSYRDESGFHVMAIPWLSRYKGLLRSNERLAFKVLQSVRKKYAKSNVLNRVDEVFQEQVKAGFIEKVENFEEFKVNFPSFSFLSHFPLIKDERETTKVRIVYMANLAEKKQDGSHGLSINQCIHPGFAKTLKIADLFTLIRFDKYLMTFDISKAYHRLRISEDNSAKFLFYWFNNVSNKDYTPVVYRCTRVIFGMSVSPYLLQCALYRFLVMEQTGDPELDDLKMRMFEGRYVDNFFLGCNDVYDLEYSHIKAIEAFESNDFPLQQFSTNSRETQESWDSIHNETTNVEIKLLGMKWNREGDILKAPEFKLNSNACTPRQVISSMKGAYDLQGCNLPVLNRCKLFLRGLQNDKDMSWDDKLSPERLREWKCIVRQFNEYEPLEIPRFIGNRNEKYVMILFSDASKDFLSTVVYVKNECGLVSFVSAHNRILDKTLKGKTMPVLEFLALEFAVEKGLEIYKALSQCRIPIQFKDIMLFTDSTIALSWLAKAELLTTKTQTRSAYLNNHINKVVDRCKESHEIKFAHVGSNDNSADYVSRALSPKKLKQSCLVQGPSFLTEDLSIHEWTIVPNPHADNDPELPKLSLNKTEVEEEPSVYNLIDLDRIPNLHIATKVLQTVKKIANIIISRLQKRKDLFNHISLLDESYKGCQTHLLRADQKERFGEIFNYFESGKYAKKLIPPLVNQMNIFLDPSDGILKVKSKMGKLCKGRISSTLILLSKEGRFTRSLVMHYHQRFNHSGTYYILHKLKPTYFILKAYSTVKNVISSCYHCKRFNSRAIKVNTNDYKDWQVNPVKRFFSHCFVDYFGPYTTWYGNEKVKTYGVIFKCIWSKMVNVEVVTNANTSSFLMAFQNHIYSYGLPSKLFSDAGSNLTRAFSWLRDILNTVEVKAYLDETGVESCTLDQYPKGSLNRGIGGIIESGVGMIRRLIQGAIRNNILEFQEFVHMVNQSVCYANKKPLTLDALREQDANDQFQVLSPEYLMFGYETAVLDVTGFKDETEDWSIDIDKQKVNRILDIKERLRNMYHSEFLHNLTNQATNKTGKYIPVQHTVIDKGDIVLIKDSFVKAPNYPLAKVLDIVKNTLGETTQAVLLKGNKSIVKRDISSLILLVKHGQSDQMCDQGGNLQTEGYRLASRPVRSAGIISRDKTRDMIAAGEI